MIYNRPGQNNQMQSESTQAENEITQEISVITETDRDNYTPYPAVAVSRRRVKREMKRIRRRARKVSGFAVVVSSMFSLAVAIGVLYLSYNGIYAPEAICNAAISAFDMLCGSGQENFADSENVMYFPENVHSDSIPVYLSQTSTEPATEKPWQVISANGEKGMANSFGDADNGILLSGKAQSVSEQTQGKTGSDGKVYLPIVRSDLSKDSLTVLSNQTKLSPDIHALSKQTPKAYENISLTDEPLVLILHTHATECYTYGTNGTYEKNEPTRSDNTEENVVAVGETLSRTLMDFGIPVLHSKTLHDKASFLNAYTSSLNEVNSLLKSYPSIRFVIDLHRDAIISADGEKTAPTASIAGENYAQLMFVIGTNEAGFTHPNWEDNLSFALDMQESVNGMYPGLMRPINLRSVSFNEQLLPGYVLLEAGACGNTLEEAKRSVQAYGTVLAKRILEHMNTD